MLHVKYFRLFFIKFNIFDKNVEHMATIILNNLSSISFTKKKRKKEKKRKERKKSMYIMPTVT